MAIEQKRVVALLDVDDTLISDSINGIVYNDYLIDSLLVNNVKDVYLLSSMSLKKHTVDERGTLIDYLKSKGLVVHGAICASDLIWKKDRGLIKEFYTAVCQTADEGILALLQEEKFQSLTDFNDAVPGEAFAAVREGIDDWNAENAAIYQNTVAAIRKAFLDRPDDAKYADQIAKSEKSYCYQMFVNKKPSWAGDVIFVDDGDKNIEAVAGMHNKLNPEYRLLTIHNKRDEEHPQSFYQALIEPFVALFNALNSYASGRKLTHSTTKNEILKNFEKALKSCDTGEDVIEVKNQFSEDYKQLNAHRISFWSKAKTRSAIVFDKMVAEREEQVKLS